LLFLSSSTQTRSLCPACETLLPLCASRQVRCFLKAPVRRTRICRRQAALHFAWESGLALKKTPPWNAQRWLHDDSGSARLLRRFATSSACERPQRGVEGISCRSRCPRNPVRNVNLLCGEGGDKTIRRSLTSLVGHMRAPFG